LGKDLKTIDWEAMLKELPETEYDMYDPPPHVKARSEEEKENLREQKLIKVLDWTADDVPVPSPVLDFAEAAWGEVIQAGLDAKKFETPTPIQAQVWPIASQGRDLVGIAETGSGKTFGYLIPLFQHILMQAELIAGDGPIGVVLVPTRELAVQIDHEVQLFGEAVAGLNVDWGLKSMPVYGGGPSVKDMGYALQMEKIDMVIATPGRFIHLLNDGWTNLRRVSFVVLDEADEMLSKGFLPQLDMLLTQIRPDRQTLMFSATWPDEIKELAQKHCHRSLVKIRIGTEGMAACRDIKQSFAFPENDEEKYALLKEKITEIWAEEQGARILVFRTSKAKVAELEWQMSEEYPGQVSGFSSDKGQERLNIVQAFKDGRTPILISTKSLGRGMDFPTVKLVINYDSPQDVESYIHQIGRTGRAGQTGHSLTFFGSGWREKDLSVPLMAVLKETNQEVPEKLQEIADSGEQKWDAWAADGEAENAEWNQWDNWQSGEDGQQQEGEQAATEAKDEWNNADYSQWDSAPNGEAGEAQPAAAYEAWNGTDGAAAAEGEAASAAAETAADAQAMMQEEIAQANAVEEAVPALEASGASQAEAETPVARPPPGLEDEKLPEQPEPEGEGEAEPKEAAEEPPEQQAEAQGEAPPPKEDGGKEKGSEEAPEPAKASEEEEAPEPAKGSEEAEEPAKASEEEAPEPEKASEEAPEPEKASEEKAEEPEKGSEEEAPGPEKGSKEEAEEPAKGSEEAPEPEMGSKEAPEPEKGSEEAPEIGVPQEKEEVQATTEPELDPSAFQ